MDKEKEALCPKLAYTSGWLVFSLRCPNDNYNLDVGWEKLATTTERKDRQAQRQICGLCLPPTLFVHLSSSIDAAWRASDLATRLFSYTGLNGLARFFVCFSFLPNKCNFLFFCVLRPFFLAALIFSCGVGMGNRPGSGFQRYLPVFACKHLDIYTLSSHLLGLVLVTD